MESDPGSDLRKSQRMAQKMAERAEAAPYVDYPPTPKWYPPSVGVWAAALVLLIAQREDHQVLTVIGILALVAIEGAFLSWYSRYHGALPSLRHPPAEFRVAFLRYLAGLAVVIGLIALAWWVVDPWAAAIVTLVSVTAGLALYEREYAAAARRTRQRLA